MSIRRVRLAFEDQYVQVPNTWARDARLSRRARGLLLEVMSHRPGWEVSQRSLAEGGPEGRDAIGSAIRELEVAGYLVREQVHGERGRFAEMDYVITDPFADVDSPSTDLPATVKPVTDNPHPKKNISTEEHLQEERGRSAPAPSRGSRLPEGWMPAPGVARAMRDECPAVNLTREHRKFIDHWRAASGKNAVKRDWDAAWRNWMRRACEFLEQKNPWGTAATVLDAEWNAWIYGTESNTTGLQQSTGNATMYCPHHENWPMPCDKCAAIAAESGDATP